MNTQPQKKGKGNFTTIATSMEQCKTIVETIRNGYEYDRKHRPNPQVAMAITLEANLGIRVSDVTKLRLCDIIRDGDRYRLDITEKKTGKKRIFTVKQSIYDYILNYAIEQGLSKTDLLVPLSPRSVQRTIENVCDYLGYERISTHSFRKMYASEIYEKNNHDVKLVQELLQHYSLQSTQRYISVSAERVENAINSYDALF